MIVGGISCRSADAQFIQNRMARIQETSPFPTDSLQWKHYRDAKFNTYKLAIDFFIEQNSKKRIDFSCLIIDTHNINHSKFIGSDDETFFQKMMYQYYVAMADRYNYPNIIRGFHGNRNSSYEMDYVKSIINSGISKKTGFQTYRPLRQFDYMRVDRSGPHQIADILLGAVSYYWNAGVRMGGSSRKRKLAEYIHSECCANSLGQRTPMSQPHFDIWPMKLR